jgi:hypothetical protein
VTNRSLIGTYAHMAIQHGSTKLHMALKNYNHFSIVVSQIFGTRRCADGVKIFCTNERLQSDIRLDSLDETGRTILFISFLKRVGCLDKIIIGRRFRFIVKLYTLTLH